MKFNSSGQDIMVAENFYESEFYVADENFRTIAHGKVSTQEFKTYKNYIFEVYNLKSARKCLLKLNYYAIIPFQKYLKCIFPLLIFRTNFFHRELPYLDKCAKDINKKNCFCKIVLLIFHVFPVYFVMSSVTFYTVMLLFHILAVPIYLFLFEFNFASFCGFPVALFFANSYFFPKIMEDFFNDFIVAWHRKNNNKKFVLPSISSFDIKPKNKMMLFPFLVPKKRSCWFYVVVLIYQVLFSLMFKHFFEYHFLMFKHFIERVYNVPSNI